MIAELIEKENIQVRSIIPAGAAAAKNLFEKLQVATRLGNTYKSKTMLTFNTLNGPKKVETTVWSATEAFVQLKHGIHIPVAGIIEVDY
ncbi:hypothetical protein C7T94_14955 [Pedobacter yulinensis]|uniref:Uncharacterized protein n=1 Tax=Pedobacter yulinensis TaxID=2126353 RepID=A0A2T3HI40_9SPHI|nr:hypothetical protein [Pedobacter yulinensis]PST82102.1 hypothetical protein C7T94_14955 [Pedobacter yulinensis]